jgi:hypothetical protein
VANALPSAPVIATVPSARPSIAKPATATSPRRLVRTPPGEWRTQRLLRKGVPSARKAAVAVAAGAGVDGAAAVVDARASRRRARQKRRPRRPMPARQAQATVTTTHPHRRRCVRHMNLPPRNRDASRQSPLGTNPTPSHVSRAGRTRACRSRTSSRVRRLRPAPRRTSLTWSGLPHRRRTAVPAARRNSAAGC